MRGIIFSDNILDMDEEYIKDIIMDREDMDEVLDGGEIPQDMIVAEWYHQIYFDEQEFCWMLNNIHTKGDIVAIGDLGLWNGRVCGYNVFRNMSEITRCCEDYNTFEIDRYNNLLLSAVHHDGTNHVKFRELKSELSEYQIHNFLDKLYKGKATSRDVTRYTRSVGHYFDEMY